MIRLLRLHRANDLTLVHGQDHIPDRQTMRVDREPVRNHVIVHRRRPAGMEAVDQVELGQTAKRNPRETIRDLRHLRRTTASTAAKSNNIDFDWECLKIIIILYFSSRKSPGRTVPSSGGDYFSNGGAADRDRVSSKDRNREVRGKERSSGSGGGGRAERDDRSKHDRYATSRSSHRTTKHRDRSRERSGDRSRDRKR